MGRFKKTEAEKKLHGTTRKDRKTNEIELPEAGFPETPPSWINTEGKRIYKKLLPQLLEVNILKGLDFFTFCSGCHEYGKYLQFEKYLKKEGYTYEIQGTTARGDLYSKGFAPRPEASLSKTAEEKARAIFSKIGLNPVDRRKISIEDPKKEDNTFDSFLKAV